VLEDGSLTDSFGRRVNFRNTVIIMTSNLGTRKVKQGGTLGFQKADEQSKYSQMSSAIMDEVRRTFNPEFLNRIDETVIFRSLERDDMYKIVDILIEEVQGRISEQDFRIELTKDARELIVDKGYDPAYGARPLRRIIRQLVEDPLSEEILAGRFRQGDSIIADRRDEVLAFRKKGAKKKGKDEVGAAPATDAGESSAEK
jgi:ATP-dependent Clp protease ATP-binding subunit ClpC